MDCRGVSCNVRMYVCIVNKGIGIYDVVSLDYEEEWNNEVRRLFRFMIFSIYSTSLPLNGSC